MIEKQPHEKVSSYMPKRFIQSKIDKYKIIRCKWIEMKGWGEAYSLFLYSVISDILFII